MLTTHVMNIEHLFQRRVMGKLVLGELVLGKLVLVKWMVGVRQSVTFLGKIALERSLRVPDGYLQ